MFFCIGFFYFFLCCGRGFVCRCGSSCHYRQRSGLAAVWEIEFRLPVTEVDNCDIVDVLFINQIYSVQLELKLNRSTNVEAYSVKPKLQQTPCWAKFFCLKNSMYFEIVVPIPSKESKCNKSYLK